MSVSNKPSNLISTINVNLRINEPKKPPNTSSKLKDLFLRDLCEEDLSRGYQLERGEYI